MSESSKSPASKKPPQGRSRYISIDGRALGRLSAAGLQWLQTNQQIINSLNVFPVPDGDTGTNMALTMQSACNEIESSADRSIGAIAHAIAYGALMGARGNSGVILSQLWRGFSLVLDKKDRMDAALLTKAFVEAKEAAYRGVVRPVEGTILTVSAEIAKAAQLALDDGVNSTLEILERVVLAADEAVQRTPDLLPVLKEAGVVDAGGIGLYFMLEGMLRSVTGQPLDEPTLSEQPLRAFKSVIDAIEPGQDWEVVIDFRPEKQLDVPKFYGHLEEMGTSIQVGEGDGLYRLHIHVADKSEYEPIEYAKSLGTVTNISIENLMVQMADQQARDNVQNIKLTPVDPGETAVVTVVPGMGIARIFSSLGAAGMVEGGQTMNPSLQDILESIDRLPTDKIAILPNNKNILLAANQAAKLSVKSIVVVPSVSIPQGVSAMIAHRADGNFENSVEAMTKALDDVVSAEITIATRSVKIDGVDVREGQVIGLLEGKLVVSGDELVDVLFEILDLCSANETELITLYYGEDLSAFQANQIADSVRKQWPDQEVELVEGGQPYYQLILSVE
ncbi:MAG: DAK2 domain-containing protein [Chloroflexi bacterium]|nr:DAK2 domain-containing protein [Chloroflexota bacterium]